MFDKPLLSQNRTMLWHGTKTENLMGILHNGLLIDAPNAVRCASAYGNGIYLADTFKKSWSYSGSSRGMIVSYVLTIGYYKDSKRLIFDLVS